MRKHIAISKEHHDYLDKLAAKLSKDRGGYVSMTQALAEILQRASNEQNN